MTSASSVGSKTTPGTLQQSKATGRFLLRCDYCLDCTETRRWRISPESARASRPARRGPTASTARACSARPASDGCTRTNARPCTQPFRSRICRTCRACSTAICCSFTRQRLRRWPAPTASSKRSGQGFASSYDKNLVRSITNKQKGDNKKVQAHDNAHQLQARFPAVRAKPAQQSRARLQVVQEASRRQGTTLHITPAMWTDSAS